MKWYETLSSQCWEWDVPQTDQGWHSGVSSRPFIYWPNAPQKQLPYNLGFVCFPVIPGKDGQEATLQDHSSRTNTAVIYQGHQMQGSNSEKKEDQGKWSLPGEEEAQSWRNSAEVPGSSSLGSYLFLFLSKLTAFWKFSITVAIMTHFYHIITPMKLLRLFFKISQLSRKSAIASQKLYLLGLWEVNF